MAIRMPLHLEEYRYEVMDLNCLNLKALEPILYNTTHVGQIVMQCSLDLREATYSPLLELQYLVRADKPEKYYLYKELELLRNKENYLN